MPHCNVIEILQNLWHRSGNKSNRLRRIHDRSTRTARAMSRLRHAWLQSCMAMTQPAQGSAEGELRCPAWTARSEEAELLRAVADQEVFGLLVVIEHHLVGFTPDARLLVAAERRMRRIGVIAVGPDPTGLDGAAEAVAAVGVPAPDAGAEAIERVVGDRQRFLI